LAGAAAAVATLAGSVRLVAGRERHSKEQESRCAKCRRPACPAGTTNKVIACLSIWNATRHLVARATSRLFLAPRRLDRFPRRGGERSQSEQVGGQHSRQEACVLGRGDGARDSSSHHAITQSGATVEAI